MKVLKDRYTTNYPLSKEIDAEINNPYPRKLKCELCDSELEYDKSDMHMGEYGCQHVKCPLCGEENMLDDNEYNIILTVDNIEFPTHFHHISKETGAVDCCERDFKEYLRKAINYFRSHKDEYDYGTHITGNLYLHVHRYSGDELYCVTVSKDFYTMDIPFEVVDY